MRLFKTPWIIKRRYPDFIWNVPSNDAIYLTFDDGPTPEVTTWVLEELEKIKAKATFFCSGKNIDKHPEIVKKVIQHGHKIGNHTYQHLNGWQTPIGTYVDDVFKCDRSLYKIGYKTELFRPPYGRMKKNQAKLLDGFKIVMWSYVAYDFDPTLDVGKSIKNLKKAKPGDIILFHDSQKAFSNLKQILPKFLDHCGLLEYKLETLP